MCFTAEKVCYTDKDAQRGAKVAEKVVEGIISESTIRYRSILCFTVACFFNNMKV